MTFANRLSNWGIASLVLLVGEFAVGEYNLYQYDHGRGTLFSFASGNQICVAVQLAAVVCGVVAMRRQSNWWLLTVVPAAVLAIGCYFGAI
jgi:carbon starvation protein CstA